MSKVSDANGSFDPVGMELAGTWIAFQDLLWRRPGTAHPSLFRNFTSMLLDKLDEELQLVPGGGSGGLDSFEEELSAFGIGGNGGSFSAVFCINSLHLVTVIEALRPSPSPKTSSGFTGFSLSSVGDESGENISWNLNANFLILCCTLKNSRLTRLLTFNFYLVPLSLTVPLPALVDKGYVEFSFSWL